jgi:hypothetical protein
MREKTAEIPTQNLINTVCEGESVVEAAYKLEDIYKGQNEDYTPIKQMRVVYRDLLDVKAFYVLMHEWFVDNRFATREDESFPETRFVFRDFGTSKQVWWCWRLKHLDGSPFNKDHFLWRVDLDVHVLGWTKVDTVIGGKKATVDKAEVEVFITPRLYLLSEKWEKAGFGWLKPFLTNVLYKKMISKEKDEFENMTLRLQEAVKTYFKLPTYLPSREGREWSPKVEFS